MVKLKVFLLVFHGIPSTFVSSTRLRFKDESAHDVYQINLFELLFHCGRFIFAFSKVDQD